MSAPQITRMFGLESGMQPQLFLKAGVCRDHARPVTSRPASPWQGEWVFDRFAPLGVDQPTAGDLFRPPSLIGKMRKNAMTK